MKGTFTIFRRELRYYFLSMSAYVFIGFYLLINGYLYSSFVLANQVADFRPVVGNMATIFLFISPLLTMRLWAEEKKHGTEQLLLTAPVKVWNLVLGKYLAALGVFAIILLITLVFPVVMMLFGEPDLGIVGTAYLGIFLLGASFIALGLFASSLTENQIIAGVVSFALLILFWLVNLSERFLPGQVGKILSVVSLQTHFIDFSRGIIDTRDLMYFASFSIFWLSVTVLNIERKRWS